MDEIIEWQKKLAAVQMLDTVYRLSERNCVELVIQLIESKRLQLIVTKNGREYLTHKQLSEEIEDEVLAHGGRINLVDLQPTLQVDLSYIEEKAKALVQHSRSISLLSGQLIANYYLDGVAEEIQQELQDAGQLAMTSLTKKFGFPIDFLTELVERRLGVQIDGQLSAGQLYTDAFIQRHHARVRAAFTALTRPCPVQNIVSQHRLQEQLTIAEVKRLIQEKIIVGTLAGVEARAVFTPQIFLLRQEHAVLEFLKANQFIEFDMMRRLQITNPQSYLTSRFASSELIMLSGCALTAQCLDSAVAALEECLHASIFTDISHYLPSMISNEDLEKLTRHCVGLLPSTISASSSLSSASKTASADENNRLLLLGPTLSTMLPESVVLKAAGKIKGTVRSLAESDRNRAEQSGKSVTAKAASDDKKSKTKKNDDSDGDENESRSKGKKKGGKDKKRGKHHSDSEEEDTNSNSRSGKAAATRDRAEEVVSLEWIVNQLKDDSAFTNVPQQSLLQIARMLRIDLIAVYREASTSIFSGQSQLRRRLHNSIHESLEKINESLQLFLVPLADTQSAVQVSVEAVSTCRIHWIRTLLTPAVDLMLNSQALHMELLGRGRPGASSNKETEDEDCKQALLRALTAEERDAIFSELAGPLASKMSVLLNAVKSAKATLKSGASCASLAAQLEECAALCELPLKPWSKKREKTMLFEARKAMLAQLKACADPEAVLLLVLLVLHSTVSGQLLHAPMTVLNGLADALRPLLTRDASMLIDNHLQLLQRNQEFRQQNEANADSVNPESSALEASVESVRQLGLEFKSSVPAGSD